MKPSKIALVGPESSGKSTLTQALAHHFNEPAVHEYARIYLEQLGRPYTEEDLLFIAQGQLEAEEKISFKARKWLFCDTNLLVIKIWSQVKYQQVSPDILACMHLESYRLHLLLAPDLPWEPDPLREHPNFREALFEMYRAELEEAQVPYAVISGEHRLEQALELLRSL